MQKFNSTIIFIAILVLLTVTNNAQYKLSIGNFWIYNYDYREEKVSIIDTLTLFDSLLYYETHLLTNSKNNNLIHNSNQHFKRAKSNGFFENLSIYHNTNDTVVTDDVFYKYNAQLGDKWIYRIAYYQDSTVVDTSWSEVVDVFEGYSFGELRTIKKIRYYSNHPQVPLDYYKFFCDDFGELSEGNYLGIVSSLKGCYIDGVAYGDTSFIVVSVSDDSYPSEFNLSQNYPNPFNPTTNIAYTINYPGKVNLTVYDVLGRKVTTLVNEYQSTGTYQVQFSVKDNQLSSGIYLYRLTINNTTRTKKMIYAK